MNRCTRHCVALKRRGISLLEVVVALGLLGTILVSVTQLSVRVNRYRRASDQRRVATREAANVMEQLHLSELTEDSKNKIRLSPEAMAAIPTARLTIDVGKPKADEARQMTVEIHWQDTAGQAVRPVTLKAWR